MIRTKKKSIAMIVTLVFLLSIMMPMAAFAADNVKVSSAYPIMSDADNQPAGWFKVVKDSFDVVDQANWKTYVTIELSNGAEFGTELTTDALVQAQVATTVSAGAAVVARVASSKTSVQFTVTNAGGAVTSLQFNVPNLNIASGTTGDVTAKVTLQALDAGNNQVWNQTATVKIGQISAGALTATAKTAKSISGAGLGVKAANIELAENQPGVLKTAVPADTVTLTIATSGVTWASAPAASGTASLAVGAGAVSVDNKTVTYTVTAPSVGIGGKLSFVLDPAAPAAGLLNVAPSVKEDIVITVGSSNTKLTDTNVTVAKIGAGEFTITTVDVKDVEGVPGKAGLTVGKIKIDQNYAGAYATNGSLVFTLKNGKWAAGPVAVGSMTSGTRYNDDRSIWYSVTAPATVADPVTITLPTVDLDANASGDIVVEISGTAGPSGEYVIGKVVPAAVFYAEKPAVKVNSLDQAAGDIKITENGKNLFATGQNLKLTLPNGIYFSKNPKVYVNGDELTVSWVGTPKGSNVAEINGLLTWSGFSGAKADVVEIKGLAYDVDSRFVAKDIVVEVSGLFLTGALGSTKTVATVANATGAEAGVVTKSFAVGDAGVAVVNGRTLVQVNMLTETLGLSKSWDAATKTAYFVKGGKVVAFPMGENAIFINGVKVPVDQGGKIVNDYTYATLRGLEMAFGGELSWDAATKTATFKF